MPIITREKAVKLREDLKKLGKKVGFTSGTFDLIHPGHVEYLNKAKALCDCLIVGVNSDNSVNVYKSPDRPVMPEEARLEVLSSLRSVDEVFLFNEENNNKNIELLKPDLYIKAGDYKEEDLSSAPIVKGYGGKIEIIPFKKGYSTSSIIEKIQGQFMTFSGSKKVLEQKPAIFLDRDGTIVEHVEYLFEPNKVKEIPGAYPAIKDLRDAGFRIIIITNQPGIGFGYFKKEDFFAVNREMLKQASKVGALIDAIYFCPHTKAAECKCRKPNTELIERAVKDYNIDLKNSYMIGDFTGDIQLGKNAGCKTILVKTGGAGEDGNYKVKADVEATDLFAASRLILKK